MMRCSVQPRYRIFWKSYGFLSFAKNMGKNISKILSGKYSHKLLDYGTQSATDTNKMPSKKAIQKLQKQMVIWLVTKLLIELRKFQKIIQRQPQMSMIKKYLKKLYISRKKERNYQWFKI